MVYATSADPNRGDGFCIIALLPNLLGDGHTLIIAGTDSQSTEAGGDFLTREEPLENLLRMSGQSSFGPFQVLLQTTRVQGSPLPTQPVSIRVGNGEQ